MRCRKRKAPHVIDFGESDDENDSIRINSPKRQRLSRSKAIDEPRDTENHASPTKPEAGRAHRDVFRELSAKEYQQKVNGPKAWVHGVQWQQRSQQPPAGQQSRATASAKSAAKVSTRGLGSIRNYFAKPATLPPATQAREDAHTDTTSAVDSAHGSSPGTATAPNHGKPRRLTARNAFSLIMQSYQDDSEDELLITTRKTTKSASASKSKAHPAQADESDFEAGSGSESSASVGSSECTASESDHTESEEDVVEVSVKKRKQSSTAPPKNKVAASQTIKGKGGKRSQNMARLLSAEAGQGNSLAPSLPPLSDSREIFEDITSKARQKGLEEALVALSGPLRVATMCSGTESPLLALEMFQDCLGTSKLEVEHLFSAEIVPFKQAYIERNFRPPVIFRDITELTSVVDDDVPMATTAYGGKVEVPRNVDLLVAGTSCVDYSALNTYKKTIDDGGESGDTYAAVLAYCKAFRPSIVILENVLGADWDRMLSDYVHVGYETAGAFVDTKRYYLPQTRQRGYMVCFDQRKGASLAGAGKEWTTLMAHFKRPASSPASSFLLPTHQTKGRQQIKEDVATREVDWTKCELRHTRLRHDSRLGNERPVTHWSESGSLLVPEGGDPTWYNRMVERVWDLLDISVLRKALPENGFYDARYKTRIWDVSQNVDFQKDTTPFGIIGCITPTMMPFISDAGRVLTAEELLKLQGLPLDKISFTTELPNDIQDLAGNAMSTTVVGPAILSALIAGHRAIDRKENHVHRNVDAPKRDLHLVTASTELLADAQTPEAISLSQLLHDSEQARRRCVCETSGKLTTKPLQRCTCCGHTACVQCAGNPAHVYTHDADLSRDRVAPNDFETYLRTTLPLALKFPSGPAWEVLAKEEQYRDVVSAIGEEFFLQSIRQTHCWTISYSGHGGHLDLVLDGAHAEWHLFADIPKKLPCNSPLRAKLEQPVAIGRVQDSFFADEWKIRIPQERHVSIDVQECGARVASWWSRNGMVDFSSHTVPEFLEIQIHDEAASMLSGKYQYLPHCGKACDSLFKRVEGNITSTSMYLFLDPTGIGEPDKDCFVFSTNIERLQYDEHRSVLARIDAPWRPWSRPGTKRPKPSLVISDVWHVAPDCELATVNSALEVRRLQAIDTVIGSADCTQTLQLLSAFLRSGVQDTNAVAATTVKTSDVRFLNQYHWALEAMGRCFPSATWRSLSNPTTSHQCERCAPRRPLLRWGLQDSNVKPYEDVPSAAAYEQAMKSRPSAIVLTATPNDGGLQLELGVNMATLAHRATARLAKDVDKLHCSWRLLHRTDRTPFVFKRLRLVSNEHTALYKGDVGLSVEMFYQQKQSLAWMLSQEAGVDFMLEETEEEYIGHTGWLAEVRARGSITLRGGICADHPGFGKTITSLALINTQLKSTSHEDIVADLEERQPPGLYATAATLIVCPASLVQQWFDEIRDKIGDLKGVIAITAPAQLSRYTIKEFQEANIIIVSRAVLASESYIDRLASFAAVPGPAATKGRALEQWREHALRQIPDHLAILKGGKSKLNAHITSRYKANMSSDEFQVSIPSRRHRGQGYVANKQKKLSAAQRVLQAAPSSVDTSTVGQPLLEMFFFNRLIVDEFHDYDPVEYAATVSLKADKRWGLSGTPAIEDFFQVAQMARLLLVDLPIGSMDAAVMKTSSRKALQKDMSKFEEFDTMWRQLPSQLRYSSIHALHQRFLDTFARQNVGDFSEMQYHDHLVPVSLDLEQRLLYTELSQHLNTLQMRIKASGKSKATDRNKRLNEAVSTSASAEEALSKAAAFMDQTSRSDHNSVLDDLTQSCSINIDNLRALIAEVASQALAKESTQFKEWKTYMVDSGCLPDHGIIEEVAAILKSASGKTSGGNKARKEGEAASEAATHKLTRLCTRLLMERRSLRYLTTARKLQEDAQQGEESNRCENPTCISRTSTLTPSRYALSAVCGHLICSACMERSKSTATTHCLASGCSNHVQEHHLLWSSKMGDLKCVTPSPFGAKLETAMRILQKVEGKGEQAIIFVQFEQQLQQVAMALKHFDISGTIVETASAAGGQLKAFRESAGSKHQQTVIVLNAADETAAGSNLQNANHVIFLSPLLQRTQYKYDSTMAQALGRVRRFGQNRPIHVYRIVALDTIDVDVLEHRERRESALVEEGQPAMQPPSIVEELDVRPEPRLERTQLVREDGHFSLRPQSWLVHCGSDLDPQARGKVKGKNRVLGWEDFSSLVKFSSKYTDDDE